MTLEQALIKIIELQQEVMKLKEQLAIKPQPYITNPFIYTPPDLCTDGNFHDYPQPWMGTVPPSCKKCGKQSQTFTVTSSSYSFNTENKAN